MLFYIRSVEGLTSSETTRIKLTGIDRQDGRASPAVEGGWPSRTAPARETPSRAACSPGRTRSLDDYPATLTSDPHARRLFLVSASALLASRLGAKAARSVRADAPLRSPLGGAEAASTATAAAAWRRCAPCASPTAAARLRLLPDDQGRADVPPPRRPLRRRRGRRPCLRSGCPPRRAARCPTTARGCSTSRACGPDFLEGRAGPGPARGVPLGVGVHHGKMTDDGEGGVLLVVVGRGKAIAVLVCTSTLAAGVNLPARRVLILKPAAWYNAGGTSGWLSPPTSTDR